jgi:hypothetical protein
MSQPTIKELASAITLSIPHIDCGDVVETAELINILMDLVQRTKIMNLQEYKLLLKHHDWSYEMSDDSKYYNRGRDQRSVLNKHRGDTPQHSIAFQESANMNKIRF